MRGWGRCREVRLGGALRGGTGGVTCSILHHSCLILEVKYLREYLVAKKC